MPATKRKRRPQYRLILTGQRLKRRFLVFVDGREAWLTFGLFHTLCQLVGARVEKGTAGYLRQTKQHACRLRRACRASDGRPSILETGADAEYRLALTTQQVSVDASFEELPAPRLIQPDVRTCLAKLGIQSDRSPLEAGVVERR